MKKIILSIAIIALVVYVFRSVNGIKVEFINNSDQTVSLVKFYTSENLGKIEINELKPGEVRKEYLNMFKNEHDGNYILEFTKGEETDLIKNGYYTNGGPLDRSAIIEFKKDTVLYDFNHRGSY